MTKAKAPSPSRERVEPNVIVDPVTPPCQEGSQPDGREPQEPRPSVRRTRTLDVLVTRRHNTEKATWVEFCAAVTALAEQIPPGVNPSVSVRRITVSWEEQS